MAERKSTASGATGAAGEAFEEAADRIRSLNERIIKEGRKAGVEYLNAYEQALNRIADFEEKVGEAQPIEWLGELANAHAAFIRDVTEAYTRAARDMLK